MAVCAVLLLVAACATRAPLTLPATLAYPDFVKPEVPSDLRASSGAASAERGWIQLQNGNLREADREYADALRRDATLFPAQAGSAYVALAGRDYPRANALFDTVLQRAPAYVPALAGRGETLSALGREPEAIDNFEAALRLDPSLTTLRSRVDVARFRRLQALIERGRSAASAGRFDEARGALQQALAASPESALLYRELGLLERRAGNAAPALDHFRRAAALDAFDAASRIQAGELLEAQGDFAAAAVAYRAAHDIDPTPDLAARAAAASARARDAGFPEQFRDIPNADRITRGDLAALIGVRLEAVVRGALGPADVLTDIRGHWAEPWITDVERAGFVEAFDNHTFQPAAVVRRVDLAIAVSRVLSQLAATRPDLRTRLAQRPTISDVGQAHLNYPQIAAAVAAGILPLADNSRFDLTRPVEGREAVDAVDRLAALASR